MSESHNDDIVLEIHQQKNCKISYVLNNKQPVRCSIIGDQPLFYTDYSGETDIDADIYEELGALSSFDKEEISRQIGETGLDMEGFAYESFLYDEEKVKGFLDSSVDITEQATQNTETKSSVKSLTELMETIGKSRLGAAYLEFLHEYNIEVSFSSQIRTAFYDRDANNILLNPNNSDVDQVLLLSRELRRVWQHKNGALIHPLVFHPDQAILVNRIQAADLDVNVVRIAWELQLSEIKGPWERLEEAQSEDLGRAFARESYLDFRTLNNGVASSAVFESWFLSDRCRYYDRVLIQQMLSDYRGYVFDSKQSSLQVTADLVVALGTMPFGKNYLAPYAETILNDALFTEVRDRSNANFLWFVKFEQSFRETEQELQTGEGVFSHDALHGDPNNKNRTGNNEGTANIVELPQQARASCERGVRSNDGANVIYLNTNTGSAE